MRIARVQQDPPQFEAAPSGRLWLLTSALMSVLLLVLTSCAGGGSEGTGGTVSRSLSGTVTQGGSTPIGGVQIALLETEASAVTDASGHYALSAELPAESSVTLGITAQPGDPLQTVDVPISDPDSTNISVDISLNAERIVQQVSRVYMWARVVGDCADYFANKEIIQQKKKTPPLAQCTMRFFVNGDTTPLASIPGAMEVRECPLVGKPVPAWRPLVTGITGTGTSAGVGEIPFTFIDNTRNCEYRIVAPYRDAPLPELEVRVRTLTYQKKVLGNS